MGVLYRRVPGIILLSHASFSVAPSLCEVSRRRHHALLFKQYFTFGLFSSTFLFPLLAADTPRPRLSFTERSEPPSLPPISATVKLCTRRRRWLSRRTTRRFSFSSPRSLVYFLGDASRFTSVCLDVGTATTGSSRRLHLLDDCSRKRELGKSRVPYDQ